MQYRINQAAFSAAFVVPSDVADKFIKLSSAVQIKVLLIVMRNSASPLATDKIAEMLGITENEVDDAIVYWVSCGILLSGGEPIAKPEKEKTVLKSEKPSRQDVAKRGSEDPKILFLLREAQVKFCRNLKSNEAQTLVWLYDDQGMDVSVILMLLEYAVSLDRRNIGFIEKTAVKWINNGVENLADAEKQIAEETRKALAFSVVSKAFGMEYRKPSDKETYLCDLWVNEWKISAELLNKAYNKCIDANAKLSFAYIAKIIESWHKKGITTAAEADAENKSAQKNDKKDSHSFAAYDLDAFEKMLDSDD